MNASHVHELAISPHPTPTLLEEDGPLFPSMASIPDTQQRHCRDLWEERREEGGRQQETILVKGKKVIRC